jgi:hypothetical protein
MCDKMGSFELPILLLGNLIFISSQCFIISWFFFNDLQIFYFILSIISTGSDAPVESF